MEIVFLTILLVVSVYLKVRYKEVLFHSAHERLLITAIIFVTMMTWEVAFKYGNIWLFPGPGMIGWYPFGFPIELYLFYIILPYFAFTVYELIHHKLDKKV